ncbi:MAG TPA: hypothetical protein VF808_12320 [Ktedonobacterales bacterium]
MTHLRRAGAVASVIALALTLASCGGSSSPKTGAATPPPAPTATRTPTPPGVWASLSGCGPDVPDAVRIKYQGAPNTDTVQRSDDCGATWNTVANPQIPGSPTPNSIIYWSVSAAPIYSDTAFITVLVAGDQQLCSTSLCQVQYVTTDGGKTWAPLKLPVPGYLDSLGHEEPPLLTTGTRLYGLVTEALITVGPGAASKQASAPPVTRLVVSEDRGAHWALCDGLIAAQGLQVAMYAAPSLGSDIYVVAKPRNDASANPPLSLWVTHEAGQTWSSAGPTPGSGSAPTREGAAGGVVSAMFAGEDGSGGASIVYLDVVVDGRERAMASADAGQTWQGNASLVFSADSNGYSPTMVGTLPDSSLLIVYPNGDGATSAWKPGSAPRIVAQNPGFRDFHDPLVVEASNGVYLWLSGDFGAAATPGVQYTLLNL